ncbi:hypothetical protein QRX50_38425 [Amycolatopsis carbonis]|uniref:Uncharacterized protein n=1 Tax=Amycolatopsis carbonis TaxID=715471 RepID=A0A9Y2MQG4_9PSEU|nr:hypothetical protein [Amycolatopsis sp. 2-15]WIX77230.1 hypothetical protein QRX50_38425 [Amycolatopsis sp. 2-15]
MVLMIDMATAEAAGERFHGSAVARFAFGLLVIAAPDSQDDHAGWDAATEAVHAGNDSLYVGVRDAASGPVGVTCVEEPFAVDGLGLLHRGEIELSRRSLAIYEPNAQLRLELPVERVLNRVSVYGDDGDEPARILVVLGDPSEPLR